VIKHRGIAPPVYPVPAKVNVTTVAPPFAALIVITPAVSVDVPDTESKPTFFIISYCGMQGAIGNDVPANCKVTGRDQVGEFTCARSCRTDVSAVDAGSGYI